MATPKKPGAIAEKILELLKRNPNGFNIHELRERIPEARAGKQEQFGRRLRELDPFHVIERTRQGRFTIYKYLKPRPEGEWKFATIDKTQRARILNKANGRCQMCGRSVEEDAIKLHIDHKIPESWGGESTDSNLWAICSICNEGKKNYFATFDPNLMAKIINIDSVHEKIALLLKEMQGEWVDCDTIEFVANTKSYQGDWRKRLRELRYFGIKIDTKRRQQGRRSVSQYMLTRWVDLPVDPTRAAREYEKNRAARNKANRK